MSCFISHGILDVKALGGRALAYCEGGSASISSGERKDIPPSHRKSSKMKCLSRWSITLETHLCPFRVLGDVRFYFHKEGHTECFIQEWKPGRCAREEDSWLIRNGTNSRRRRVVTEAVHCQYMSVSCYVCNGNKWKQWPGNKPRKQNKETKPHSGLQWHSRASSQHTLMSKPK